MMECDAQTADNIVFVTGMLFAYLSIVVYVIANKIWKYLEKMTE
jgi:hypothetical protein